MGRSRIQKTCDLLDVPCSRPKAPIKGYQPSVLDMGAGRLFSLEELAGLAHACISRDEALIRARQLGKGERVLVFSARDLRRPFCGGPGDWLACHGEGDFAVIGRYVFDRSRSKP